MFNRLRKMWGRQTDRQADLQWLKDGQEPGDILPELRGKNDIEVDAYVDALLTRWFRECSAEQSREFRKRLLVVYDCYGVLTIPSWMTLLVLREYEGEVID